MNIHHIEDNIKKLSKDINEEAFIYDFLLSYGIPKASVTRLHRGDFNASKEEGEVLWKKKIFFRVDKNADLLSLIDDLKRENRVLKYKPMFIIVTDFKTILALDLKVGDTLDIPIRKIVKHFEFFLPLVGMEKTKIQSENPADIKAADKLGKLYDVLVEQNEPRNAEDKHILNVFLSRLLFCFFAEDTNIFPDSIFTNSIASHTKPDGSDLKEYLVKLFKVLDTKERKGISGFLAEFPYVNGGLFEKELEVPSFNSKSYKIIIECGSLNWAFINPDIFGSMIQSVANAEIRSDMGMHYTSVVNIMKVIEPLFLNDLKKELKEAGTNKKKLRKLLNRLYHLRIFDPACGSGNFLIIAYKELCAIEIEIYKALYDEQMSFRLESGIKTSQFYGIEVNDFACETAKLSLWLAEHQMNLHFEEIFGVTKPTLPLEDGGNIKRGNACRMDWEEVCPKDDGAEIYILGNPPYKGAKAQSAEQKSDLKLVLKDRINTKSLDYISCWFVKASLYMDDSVKVSFVSTNSIYQGAQVSLLWPFILEKHIEIYFCNKDFLWTNNAKNKAGVTCSIVGFTKKWNGEKFIVYKDNKFKAKNINPYLIDFDNIFVYKRSKPLSNIPFLQNGNQPYDGGHLLFTNTEKEEFLNKTPEASVYFRKLIGSSELIRGSYRWCLWIEDNELSNAVKIPAINERIENVRESRINGGDAARSCKDRPHQFRWVNRSSSQQICLPIVSSERRSYIPMSFVDTETIINNLAQVIYDANAVVFSILNSRMHMAWVKVITGRLKLDYRYTAGLCYNSYPIPELTDAQVSSLEEHTFKILEARETHSEMSLAQLYDPDKMPKDLRDAHRENDLAVDSVYRKSPFKFDKDRLEHLFKLYEKMIQTESKKDTK